MSKHFAFDRETGEWGDIVWRKQPLSPDGYRYIVWVGNRRVGEIWPTDPGWVAIAYGRRESLLGRRSVSGFRSRWAATDYLLDVAVRPAPEE